MKIRLHFTDELLGVMSNQEDLLREYIASKAPDATTIKEEIEAVGVDAVAERSMTVFPRADDETPFVYDYQLRGMFKDAIGMLKSSGKSGNNAGKACSKITAHKKKVDGQVFIKARKNLLDLHGMEMGFCSRTLRASTAQGERISIAKSETVPAGSTLDFEIVLFDDTLAPAIIECLNYGIYRGLGQWRNSGKGTFMWEELDDNGNVIGGNYDPGYVK